MRRYGDNKFQVVPNSVFRFEQGVLVCGSNQNASLHKYIPVVDGVYTDPPWNQGNMKMFYGFAHRRIEKDFLSLMDGVFALIRTKVKKGGLIVSDMGIDEYPHVMELLKRRGFYLETCSTTYYGSSKRPCHTFFGSFGHATHWLPQVEGKHGTQVTKAVVDGLIRNGAKSMFDPCCGKLMFLREGLKRGMKIYGMELIPEKLSLGLEYIERKGYKIERVQ